MEKLREAIRNLEKQAEKYERHLGAERFASPGEEFFDMLASEVDGVTAELAIPEPASASSTSSEEAKQEEAPKV